MNALLIVLAVMTGLAHAEQPKTDDETIPVTGDNYAQAESAANFDKWAKLGSDKKLFHYRELAPVGPSAPTVRMNWDTLYSCRIVKVSDDHTALQLRKRCDQQSILRRKDLQLCRSQLWREPDGAGWEI